MKLPLGFLFGLSIGAWLNSDQGAQVGHIAGLAMRCVVLGCEVIQ